MRSICVYLLFCVHLIYGFLLLPDTNTGTNLGGLASLPGLGSLPITNFWTNYLKELANANLHFFQSLTGGGTGGTGSLTDMNTLLGSLLGGGSLPGLSGSGLPGLTGGGAAAGSAGKLEQYNVDRSQISVSGISSGAAMATQMHVIFSKDIMGVGLVAGLPYGCSGGNMMTALTNCMTMPSSVSAASLESRTQSEASRGEIDATSNMANDKVFILNGRADSTVNPGIGHVIESYYDHFVTDKSNIKTNFDINSQHCMPTDNYGGACAQAAGGSHYISNCNYSAAFHLLNHIYGGNLKMPTPESHTTGQLLRFSQSEFFPSSAHESMDTIGYVYVPAGCANKTTQCRLHVAFHGCLQGQESIGDAYVAHGGYNQVADLNNIIILYPQAVKSIMSPMNPNGCWDWWGYSGANFDRKTGFQPVAVKAMIDRITG